MHDNKQPIKKRRAESFLGIHFDFHAGEDCSEIGARTTPEMIETIIREVQPDYIQCDCKGHKGLSSYPTKIGYAAPGVVKDALRIWREVTEKNGVALYMHYSGVWDKEALLHHPSWARIDEKGRRDKQNTSVFGPYVDKLLIPQLKELCDEYGVDGVWVDGDCWAAACDYGRKVLKAFRKETGLEAIPRKPEDPNWYVFKEFCREGFRKYLRHYADSLHRHNPDFQIASNWSFSSFMPEPVSADVDFLSGDYTLQNSVNSARLEGRCLAGQGRPWDLMAWAFSCRFGDWIKSYKSIPQLQREAAAVLMLGGGFQAYFQQKRDGSVALWQMQLMKGVAEFCRARQQFCHKAESVPQVGLYYSTADYYRRNDLLFTTWKEPLRPMKGILQNLLENQYSVDILMDHHIQERVRQYPLIVIPEWNFIEGRVREELLKYVQNGGNILLIGPGSTALFEKELDIEFAGDVEESLKLWVEHDNWLGGFKTAYRKIRLGPKAEAVGRLFRDNDKIGEHEIPGSISSYGMGKIGAIHFNMGDSYIDGATSLARDFLGTMAGRLFTDPLVKVTGSHQVDVAVNRKDGKLMINLLNTAGPHADANVFVHDDIPAVGPLTITIHSESKPAGVWLMPEGIELEYRYAKGEVRLILPRLEIHSIIMME